MAQPEKRLPDAFYDTLIRIAQRIARDKALTPPPPPTDQAAAGDTRC